MLPLRRRRFILLPAFAALVLACEDPAGPRTPTPDAAVAVATFTLTRIATGLTHSCGIDPDGLAYCWGFGAMGDGTSSSFIAVTPVPVAGGHHFVELRPAAHHTCGLTTDGKAWCWGDNTSGQLGDGTLSERRTPVLVGGGHRFTQVRTGSAHSCGLTAAGIAWCWGHNGFGELGLGNATGPANCPLTGACSKLPVRVTSGL